MEELAEGLGKAAAAGFLVTAVLFLLAKFGWAPGGLLGPIGRGSRWLAAGTVVLALVHGYLMGLEGEAMGLEAAVGAGGWLLLAGGLVLWIRSLRREVRFRSAGTVHPWVLALAGVFVGLHLALV